ncbi:MAG: cytochrome c maturation protein CcmE [Acidobacteriota bacterium]
MRVKIMVALIIVVGALVLFFLSTGSHSQSVYYLTPSQFLSNSQFKNERVRLKGKIEPGTVKMSKDRMDVHFDITDGKKSVPVAYRGAIPDAFQEGMEVVVDGRMGPKDFKGHELIVKCPSKYESRFQGGVAKEAAAK